MLGQRVERGMGGNGDGCAGGNVARAECSRHRHEGRRAPGNPSDVGGHAFGGRLGGVGIDEKDAQGHLIPESGLPLR
jgi:hypothetical protein